MGDRLDYLLDNMRGELRVAWSSPRAPAGVDDVRADYARRVAQVARESYGVPDVVVEDLEDGGRRTAMVSFPVGDETARAFGYTRSRIFPGPSGSGWRHHAPASQLPRVVRILRHEANNRKFAREDAEKKRRAAS